MGVGGVLLAAKQITSCLLLTATALGAALAHVHSSIRATVIDVKYFSPQGTVCLNSAIAKSHSLSKLFVVDAGPEHVVRVCVVLEVIDKVVRHANKFTESHQTLSIVYITHTNTGLVLFNFE